MPDAYTITLTDTPDPADARAVGDGLHAYNVAQAGSPDYRPLALFVRDGQERIAGGLLGGTYWGWLYVETLWVDAPLRGQGYGSRLLEMAEQEALRRGCHHAHLDTMSFQAPSFYRGHGYTQWGELQDLPAGHTRIFLKKELKAGASG